MLVGLYGYHVVAAHLTEAGALAEQLMRIAERERSAVLGVMGHFARGLVRHALGDQVAAHAENERALALYEPSQHRTHLELYRANVGIYTLGETVRTLWLLGYPDQALARAASAVEAAQALGDPRSLAFVLVFATFVRQFRREPAEALAWAERTEALCDEYGIAADRAWVVPVRGWALAALGHVDEGLETLREGIAALRRSGAELTLPYYYALLADALVAAGRTGEALDACDEGLAVAHRTGQVCYDPELHRLRGECVLQAASAEGASLAGVANEQAERCFAAAVDLARSQHAKVYELRAAMRLAQLRWDRGHRADARRILGDVLAWFTEGSETVDLRDARRLSEAFARES
jgi:adenylate cyclase